MSELARSHERALFRKVHQVAGRCCRRRTGDGAVLAGAKSPFETRAFFEHAQQRLLLPLVELPFQPVKQLCLLDQKFYECKRPSLCFNRHSTKPSKPFGNFILSAGCFQRMVVTRASGKDGGSKHNECRLPETLCQRLFGNRPAYPAVAIFKRMDRLKIQMCSPSPCQRWQRFCSSRSCALEPVDESRHLERHLRGWRCLEMDLRCTYYP